jgi:hypothetical protein
MRSRPTATAHDIGDLINAMPTMFGFPPHDSLVCLGLDGKRICFGMRLDLSDAADVERTADYVARHLQNQVAGSGIDGAIVIAVGQPLELGRELVLAVESRLFAGRCEGLRLTVDPVAGGWATDNRYWVSMADGDPNGYPYQRSLAHPITLQGIAEGQEIVGSRAELEARFEPVGGAKRGWLDSTSTHIAARREATLDAELADLVLPVVHDLYATRPVGDGPVLELAYAMTRIAVRDLAWELITPANARDMVRVWVHVARWAPTDWAPPALSLAAFAAWLTGDGACAVAAAQRALGIDPGYSMGALMLRLATSGIAPDAWHQVAGRVRD